ncbi:hypothetical protein [Haloarchaeobius sp. DT45]|uniref:hypothetical protein n=1 Tax=Haloarchaeobius sp. DT45 TaxID=3446116 RepID=UPI003F6BFA3F
MASPSRRALIQSLAVAVPAVSGCLAAETDDSPASTDTSSPTADTSTATAESAGDSPTSTPTNCPAELPDPPANPTAATARGFAESYEYAVAYNDACQYEQFSLYGVTASDGRAVLTRSENAFYVTARESYSYTDGDAHADAVSHGLYRVGDGTFTRVDRRDVTRTDFDDRAGRDHPQSHRLHVLNFGAESVEATVTVVDRETGWRAETTPWLPAEAGIRATVALDAHPHDVTVEVGGETTSYRVAGEGGTAAFDRDGYVFVAGDEIVAGRWAGF